MVINLNHFTLPYKTLYDKRSPRPDPKKSYAFGDVDYSHSVDIKDALTIAIFSSGQYIVLNKEKADVNCDKAINIIDALLIAQNSLDLIKLPSACPIIRRKHTL